MTDRVLTTSRYNDTFEEWEDTELADVAKVLAWAAREHSEVLVGVVRHLPNAEEVGALWMDDPEFGEPIHYLPVEGPGRYLVVELGQ